MTWRIILEVSFFAAVLTALAVPLGLYMAKVFEGERTLLSPLLRPIEGAIYRLAGVNPYAEMSWTRYLGFLLLFNFWGLLVGYLLLRWQNHLPLNPLHLPGVPGALAFNTIVSFVTNTNWQAYSGETTMSYFSQMFVLAVQNFLSAATGLAGAVALARAFARKEKKTLGNVWVDLTRSVLYILLPISVVVALVLVSQGVVQTFHPPVKAVTLEGREQTIPLGPVASQEVIKLLGTNGGGFFNANSAHPFENPNPFTNFVEAMLIIILPAALCFTFGRMIRNMRQGWVIYGVMMFLFLVGAFACCWFEAQGNPLFSRLGFSSGPNLEGKEWRFGAIDSALFAAVTTAVSCGAVDSLHDSFTPLGGLVPLANMLTGEVIFGGIGSGLYGMIAYALLTVFLAGLMVGRSPEFLGKKIEKREVKLSLAVVLVPAFLVLFLSALAVILPAGREGITAAGPHGLSQVLYAFASTANNNGSAFGGLKADLPFYLWTTALAMLLGRFLPLAAVLALAGSLVEKKTIPPSPGTFPTTGWLFAVLLVGVIVIVGALTFFPGLALGPILEQLLLSRGRLF
ncbi:potassium-transporting ATPase subunit KdpA [Ammonifex thiophilus]|uniref:Potassium-transporting ATPase potassium-binding subunit n=1 Tax=Ammonifex thiophilus TaxID=444093 RepID=A0A3D8P3L0_9THEO|nr:potassium-transporting ATPase subunit KdpA [Ammonifex thiophilus]RDV83405.1 potassium-transporting ATPase subunit KdpA [Ammonifex thiophilus]